MSTLRTKAEHIVVNVFQVPPQNRPAAIQAVLSILQQPDEMPPFELREMFEAFKMVAMSLVQHQQHLDHDLQRVQMLLGLDERFDFVYTKEQLDTSQARQSAQFKLLNTATAKLHNIGVRQGWIQGALVDENALFAEFHALNQMYNQACAVLQEQLRRFTSEGEEWKQDPLDEDDNE